MPSTPESRPTSFPPDPPLPSPFSLPTTGPLAQARQAPTPPPARRMVLFSVRLRRPRDPALTPLRRTRTRTKWPRAGGPSSNDFGHLHRTFGPRIATSSKRLVWRALDSSSLAGFSTRECLAEVCVVRALMVDYQRHPVYARQASHRAQRGCLYVLLHLSLPHPCCRN